MAVTFVIGNATKSRSVQSPTRLSVAGNLPEGELYLSALIELGLILFFVTFVVLACSNCCCCV